MMGFNLRGCKDMLNIIISSFLVFLIILSFVNCSAEDDIEIAVDKISANNIECQIKGDECILLNNFLNVYVVVDRDIDDSDLSITKDEKYIKTLSHGCEPVHKNYYVCYFEVDPIIKGIRGVIDYDMSVSLYPVGGGNSFNADMGSLRIVPIEPYIDGLEKKISKVKDDYSYLRSLSMDVLFNGGICSIVSGNDISFENIRRYEEYISNLSGLLFSPSEDIEISRLNNLISISLIYGDNSFTGSSLVTQYETRNMIYAGYMSGFMTKKIPTGEDILWSPWRDWGITDKISINCEAFKEDSKKFIDPLFYIIRKNIFLDCMEDSHISECLNLTEDMEENIIGSSDSAKASFAVIVDGEYLREGNNICGGSSIELEHSNLGIIGADHIDIYGKDGEGCHSEISFYGINGGDKFFCGYPDKPKDGGKYEIVLPYTGGNITYHVFYYDSPDKCRIHQESISID